MSRVTYIAVKLVWISVLGERRKGKSALPLDRADTDKVVERLFRWCVDNEIRVIYNVGGVYTSGELTHAFAEEDAEKVVEWLRANGVRKRKSWR